MHWSLWNWGRTAETCFFASFSCSEVSIIIYSQLEVKTMKQACGSKSIFATIFLSRIDSKNFQTFQGTMYSRFKESTGDKNE